MTLFGTAVALLARGETNAMVLMLPISVITAGFILGPKKSFLFAGLSIFVYVSVDIYLHYNGALLVPDQGTMILNNYLAVVSCLFVAALVTWLFTRNMSNYVKELERREKEKEVLLKEIHHRVKNNLQIISSLLNLQSEAIKDEDARKLILESIGRIKSMSLIHERLYSSKDLSDITLRNYVEGLLANIIHAQTASGHNIDLEHKIDDVKADFETALTIGLIVNELVTNSIKHAFKDLPETEGFRISVSILKRQKGLEIIVSDNGRGMDKGIDYANPQTLGLQLVNTLAEELEGTISVDGTKGTRFSIEFVNRGG